MQWLEVSADTRPELIDGLCRDLEDAGVEGLVIDDQAEFDEFFENNRQYWDYIDQELQERIKGVCRVIFYLPEDDEGRRELERIRGEIPYQDFSWRTVRDEDWENNWKQYYKPVPVGDKLLIVPQWEEIPESGDRYVLRLDPGLIFGTGTHPTTKMCLTALEKLELKGRKVLDLGCGSGILSIAALIMGADTAVGWDIDPKAPDIALENGQLNGIGEDRFKVFAGDVLSENGGRGLEEQYEIVLANIVADVIIALSEKAAGMTAKDGVFICSGIIDGRQAEVEKSLRKNGFKIIEKMNCDGWHCFVSEPAGKDNGEN